MYLVTSPWWLRKLYGAGFTWNIPTQTNEIFITFDDGPHPRVTPFVLDCLQLYNATATFFCIGKNVQEHPGVYKQIIDQGHSVGNHTQDHLNGWKVNDQLYFDNISIAKSYINSRLFRPPYGRISRSQVKHLAAGFDIIMWNVLSGDFDVNLSPEKCLRNVTANTRPGSVVVFHDSEKAFRRLEFVLPRALQYFTEKGFAMKCIKMG